MDERVIDLYKDILAGNYASADKILESIFERETQERIKDILKEENM
jgi:hypothetical protein